jgi:hypothetical protein
MRFGSTAGQARRIASSYPIKRHFNILFIMVHTLAGLTFPIQIVESNRDTRSTDNRQKTTKPNNLFHSARAFRHQTEVEKPSPRRRVLYRCRIRSAGTIRKSLRNQSFSRYATKRPESSIAGAGQGQGAGCHNPVLKAEPEGRP